MNRAQIFQEVIDKYKFNSYLEVGVGSGWTYLQLQCDIKVGVDPVIDFKFLKYHTERIYKMTSDEFFMINKDKFDIIFIDGLHLHEQVIKDICNSWNTLNKGGFIFIHDCLPGNEAMCSRDARKHGWTGDVYKALLWFICTYPKYPTGIINEETGIGVILKLNDDSIKVTNFEEYSNVSFKEMKRQNWAPFNIMSPTNYALWLKKNRRIK